MADKKKMSVAEILAAARAEKAGGGSKPAGSGETAAAESAAVESAAVESAAPKPAAAKPAAGKSAAAKPAGDGAGGRPSVKDILAMARKNQPAGEAAASSAAAKPAAPAAAKAAAAKPAAAKPAAAKPAAGSVSKPFTSLDTASILASVRASAKPGPVSKADAPPMKPRPAAEKKPAAAAPGAAKPIAAKPIPKMPAKAVKAAAKADEEDRRSFLQIATGSFLAVGFTALSVTGGLFTLGLARFMFPNVLAEPPSRFKVGFKEGFPSGKVETKYVAQYGVWVVNSDVAGQQQIYALKTVCTHLGCTPNWLEAEQKFKCPCHGSGFYKDGVNFEGPAPRPLERYAIRVADDGQLEIDKSRSFQEELGQWADPESFIPV